MLRLSASDALCTRLEALVTPSNGVFFALVLAVGESAVVFRALNPRDRVTPCDSGSVDNCVYVEKLWTEVKAGGCPQSASRRAAALEPHPDTEFEGAGVDRASSRIRSRLRCSLRTSCCSTFGCQASTAIPCSITCEEARNHRQSSSSAAITKKTKRGSSCSAARSTM